MNEDDGEEFAKSLGDAGRFFKCNVLETESIAKAVQGAADWAKQTGKSLGGIIPAAGVSTPATVSCQLSTDAMGHGTLTPARFLGETAHHSASMMSTLSSASTFVVPWTLSAKPSLTSLRQIPKARTRNAASSSWLPPPLPSTVRKARFRTQQAKEPSLP